MLCQNGFRMKLHAGQVILKVSKRHNFLRVGPCGDFQTGGERRFFDDQRVVAGCLEALGNSAK